MSNTPTVDRSPPNYQPGSHGDSQLKRKLRTLLYPPLTWLRDKWLRRKYAFSKKYDKVFLGQRGNDYDSHRLRVNQFRQIRGSTILIIGCGAGRDLESWALFRPQKIIGIDYFNYSKAWERQKSYLDTRYKVTVEFHQGDASDLSFIEDETVDIVGSDAVLEHLRDLENVTAELYRIIRPSGVFYSTFGPLWYTWGGDHISGRDGLNNGYNHILLDSQEYSAYLESFGPYDELSDDSRIWIYNNLFSYLKPEDYREIISKQFRLGWASALIDERSIKFVTRNKNELSRLVNQKLTLEDILVSGISIIALKDRGCIRN